MVWSLILYPVTACDGKAGKKIRNARRCSINSQRGLEGGWTAALQTIQRTQEEKREIHAELDCSVGH